MCNLWRLFRTKPQPASSSSVQGFSPKTAWLCLLYTVFLFWAITSGGEAGLLIVNSWVGVPSFQSSGSFSFLWPVVLAGVLSNPWNFFVFGFVVFVAKVQGEIFLMLLLCFGKKIGQKINWETERRGEGRESATNQNGSQTGNLLLLSPLAEAVIFESTFSQEVCRGFSQQI